LIYLYFSDMNLWSNGNPIIASIVFVVLGIICVLLLREEVYWKHENKWWCVPFSFYFRKIIPEYDKKIYKVNKANTIFIVWFKATHRKICPLIEYIDKNP